MAKQNGKTGKITLSNGFTLSMAASNYIRSLAEQNDVSLREYIKYLGQSNIEKIVKKGIKTNKVFFRYDGLIDGLADYYHFFLDQKLVSENEFRIFLNDIYHEFLDEIQADNFLLEYQFYNDYVNRRFCIKKIQLRHSEGRDVEVLYEDFLPEIKSANK